MTDDLRYPIGPFQRRDGLGPADRATLIDQIAALPAQLQASVTGLDNAQLDTPYRPGGWTVKQVVHHLADSHMNAFTRFRLGLTEHEPTVKPYNEKAWAELADSTLDPALSLAILGPLHQRMVTMLRAVADDGWARVLHHPESGRMTVDTVLQIYAWHGRHHVAHITALRARMGW